MADSLPQFHAPVALTIAGSDSGGNAGIQADLLSFAANGVYGTSAITCLTAQNPQSISAVEPLTPSFVSEQIKQVFDYFKPTAVKTGMLWSAPIIETIAEYLAQHPNTRIVVDPVMVSTSGQNLLSNEAVSKTKSLLLPLADIITPNLDEAAALLDRPIETIEHMHDAALELSRSCKTTILLKGGHMLGDQLVDILVTPSGDIQKFTQTRIKSIDTHGSGCTLSAAIAAWLAKGSSIQEAVKQGRAYLRSGMENPVNLASKRFINHFPQ